MVRIGALHGFANTHLQWEPVAAFLPEEVELVAIALPGHVDGPPCPLTWEHAIERVAEALGGVRQVVGYSMGARIALGLISAGFVDRALLIGVHPGFAASAARRERVVADNHWVKLLRSESIESFAAAWAQQPLFAYSQQRNPSEFARRQQARLRNDPNQLADALLALGTGVMPPLAQALLANARAIELVVGGDDSKFAAIAHDLQSHAPELAVHTITASGHDPTLEAPRALAEILSTWAGSSRRA